MRGGRRANGLRRATCRGWIYLVVAVLGTAALASFPLEPARFALARATLAVYWWGSVLHLVPFSTPSGCNVALAVDYGSAGSLTVDFGAPLSDGGADVTRYRVELDPTETFDAPVREDFECATANKRAVWSVQWPGPC